MVRLDEGTTVSIKLRTSTRKNSKLMLLNDKTFSDISVDTTWISFIRDAFSKHKVINVDAEKITVYRKSRTPEPEYHPSGEKIRVLLEKWAKNVTTYYVVSLCETEPSPRLSPYSNRSPSGTGAFTSTRSSKTIRNGSSSRGNGNVDNGTTTNTQLIPEALQQPRDLNVRRSQTKRIRQEEGVTLSRKQCLLDLGPGGSFNMNAHAHSSRNGHNGPSFNPEVEYDSSKIDVIEAQIPIEQQIDLKNQIKGRFQTRVSNNQLLLIREELKSIQNKGKWGYFSSPAPKLGNMLFDLFFN